MRFYLIIIFVLLSLVQQAQSQEWDTLSFQGEYLVQCACVKKKVVVVDVEDVNDSSMVWRLMFEEGLNDAKDELNDGDTLHMNMYFPFTGFHYSLKYAYSKYDGSTLIVSQPKYHNRSGRVIFINDWIGEKFHVSTKCPNSVVYRDSWLRRRFL